MKQKLINFFLLILTAQVNIFAAHSYRIDDVNPLDLLKPSLTLQANVYYGDQDEESSPIAETEFYLLDESLVKILKDSSFNLELEGENERSLEDEDYLTAAANAFSSEDEESKLIALLINKAISQHQLFSLKTNFQGEAKIKSIKIGNYYLFGIGQANDEVLIWHFPVSIKLGCNDIEVDQHNAMPFSIND